MFTRRYTIYFNSVPSLAILYSALVRCISDYSSIDWNLPLLVGSKLIERVENRFFSFAVSLVKIDYPQRQSSIESFKIQLI